MFLSCANVRAHDPFISFPLLFISFHLLLNIIYSNLFETH